MKKQDREYWLESEGRSIATFEDPIEAKMYYDYKLEESKL